MTDRLTEDEVRTLIAQFDNGTPKQKLAEQHGISVGNVKQLLRKYREPK